jgi:hypothetical protein
MIGDSGTILCFFSVLVADFTLAYLSVADTSHQQHLTEIYIRCRM